MWFGVFKYFLISNSLESDGKGEKEKRRKGEKEKRRKGEKEKRRKGESKYFFFISFR